ncbi:MAG TPA: hypothetical protein VJR24_18535 [Gemmatimonadaceae bacterium]|nr:hypothetical protein [Gemmatimonadaceae bacterium]
MTTKNSRMLPDEADRLLTELWRRLLTGDAKELSRREVTEFARPVCAIARAAGLLPEELIVAVKQSWNSRHELRPPTQRRRLEHILASVISACIEEFYRVDARPSLERTEAAGGGHASATELS